MLVRHYLGEMHDAHPINEELALETPQTHELQIAPHNLSHPLDVS